MIRRLALSGCSTAAASGGAATSRSIRGRATSMVMTMQQSLLSVATAPASSVQAAGPSTGPDKSAAMDATPFLRSNKKYIHDYQVIQVLPVTSITAPTAALPRRAFSTTKQTQVQAPDTDPESSLFAASKGSRGHVYIRTTHILDLIHAEKFQDAKEAMELYIQVNRNLKQPNKANRNLKQPNKANQTKKFQTEKFKHVLNECLEVVKRYQPSKTMRQQELNDSMIDPATGKKIRLAERTNSYPQTKQTPHLPPNKKAIQAAQLADFILQQLLQLGHDNRLDQPIPSWSFGMVILAHALSATPHNSRECRALEILHQLQDYYYNLPATGHKNTKMFRPKPGDYNNVVLAMVNAGQLEQAQDFLMSFSMQSRDDIVATMSQDRNTKTKTRKNSKNNTRGDDANKTIQWSALARRVLTMERPTLVGYQTLLAAYRRHGNEQPHAADVLLRDIIQTCVTVLDEAEAHQKKYHATKNDRYKRNSYTEEHDPARVIAENIMSEFLPGLDRINYVLGIWCYSETIPDQEAYQGVRSLYEYCFAELAKFGCIPDFYSYYLWLDTHARRGDADGAGQVFRELNYHISQNPYSATPLSIEHVNVVLKAFARAYVNGNDTQAMEKARVIMQDVRERHAAGELNFGLNTVSYNTLIHAHGERGQPRLATRLFDDLVQEYHASQNVNAELKPNTFTFNVLLWAVFADRSTEADRLAGERADYIFNTQMPRFGVQPNTTTYGTLRKCWMKAKAAGHPQAERRLQELRATYSSINDFGGRKNEQS